MDLLNLTDVQQPVRKLLLSPDTKVEDLLSEPMTFRLFSMNDQGLIRYFKKHSRALLGLALDTSKGELSSKAFAI